MLFVICHLNVIGSSEENYAKHLVRDGESQGFRYEVYKSFKGYKEDIRMAFYLSFAGYMYVCYSIICC